MSCYNINRCALDIVEEIILWYYYGGFLYIPVGGVMQNIVYGEYIPTVLGPGATRLYGVQLLESGYYDGKSLYLSSTMLTKRFDAGPAQSQRLVTMAIMSFNVS